MKKFFIILKKWLLLSLLLLICFTFFYFHLYDYLTLTTINTYQVDAQQWTAHHYQDAVFLYLVVYILTIACAIPCATLLTLLGGFLFGSIAFLYAILGTTLGGTILFLAVRTAVGARIAKKSTGWIKNMEAGFQRNAFNYLLMLRLVPVFPCWVSNISAGVLNVPLKTFVGATVLGIIPATFIYVMVGRGLDKFLITKQSLHLSSFLTADILFPLIGLTILSLFPVFYKSIRKRHRLEKIHKETHLES